MKTIWKFQIEITDRQIIRMPAGAEILTIQTQHGEPCIWSLVDTDGEQAARVIEVFGTGHPIADGDRRYIGTFQVHGGSLVFHAFEKLSA